MGKIIVMKKVLIGLVVVALLLFVFLFTAPFLFQEKINAVLKEEINTQLNAKVNYGSFSLSLIKSFPNFNFSINDLSVVGVDSFKGDTLVRVSNFGFTLDILTVLKGEKYKLLALNLTNPTVNAIVNYSGKANWDITKETKHTSASEESEKFALEIKKYKIVNGEITYTDKQGNTSAKIHGLDFEGSGDITQSVYDLITKTSIAELTYKSGAVPYLSKVKLSAEMRISIDNTISKYTFKENSVSLNDLHLEFDGWVQPKKDLTALDVKFKTKQTQFKSILSLIPAVYQKDFDKVKTSGSLALDGNVKGELKEKNYPAFNVNLKVANGLFQYPGLPVAVKNISIAGNITKPQGNLDFTIVDVSKLHLEAGTDPVDARINVRTPISNPNVTANVTGRLNLANVPKFYPIEGLKTLTGLLAMDLDFKGKKSDVDNKNYNAIHASGNAKISNLIYDSKETPMAVKVMSMLMTFNPQNVKLNNFSAAIGKSDFNATGTLDNFMAYAFGKGDLTGEITLRSAQFDANEWLQKDNATATKNADTSNTQFFKVPAHINFTANSQFGKLFYEKIELTNVKGQVQVVDEAIHLNNLFANVLGGDATISAVYDTKNRDYPDVSFNYDINNFDIQQTYKQVGMSDKLAPVMKYIQGNFSSDMKGSGKLKPDMSVDYSSLTGDGKVEIPSAKIVGLPILQKVTEVAKIPALQNLELKNSWTVLKFKSGRVFVDPTDLKFGNGYNVNVQGSNGFDQTIDYDMRMDVPSKELGAASSIAQGYLSKVPGLGNAMPEVVGFLFKVTGTTTKPQVKLQKVLANGTSAKDMVKNAAEDLKKKAEEEAKARVEDLKKQAEEQLRKAAEQQAKQAFEKAKTDAAAKAKKEAEDRLKNVLKFPK